MRADRTRCELDDSASRRSANLHVGGVLDRWKALRECTRADVIAADRNLQTQRIVRPLSVVNLTPQIECTLSFHKVGEAAISQHFGRQRAMETLVLSLRLRMIRTTVADRDPQSQQPRRQACPGLIPCVAPRRAVVHQHPTRQSMMAEYFDQFALHRFRSFVVAGSQPQRVPRVIVEYRE